MREKKYHLYLTADEQSKVIQSLIDLKNNLKMCIRDRYKVWTCTKGRVRLGSKKILIRIIGLALSLSLVFSGQAGTFHVFAEDMTVENPDSTGSGQGASQDEDYKGALADLGEQLKDLQAQQDAIQKNINKAKSDKEKDVYKRQVKISALEAIKHE